MNDYSEYLNGLTATGQPMLDYIESEWQKNPQIHQRQATIINEVCRRFKLKKILEIGCATGNIIPYLNEDLKYLGADKNHAELLLANAKFPKKSFVDFDIRVEGLIDGGQLIFCFAFLKHFGLHEWETIFQRCAALGKYFVFDIPISGEVKDDGIQYHHVWLTMEVIKKYIEEAGLELIEIFEPESVEPIFICKKK